MVLPMQDADLAAPHAFEQGLFLRIRVGVADGGDLLAGNAASLTVSR